MATSVRLIRRYVWLVDTIRRAGNISLDEINDRWFENYALNPGHETEIPERTFHRHREAIIDLFDVEHEILCLGHDAEVLSPQWLRDDMKWYAEELLKRYVSVTNK